MQLFFGIAYFVIGLFQLFAVIDGIEYGLGIGGFFAFILALFVTYIPLLGSIIGVYGAVNVWDWSILQAGSLFFWYVPILVIAVALDVVGSRR